MRQLKRKGVEHGYLVENEGVTQSGERAFMDAHPNIVTFERGSGHDRIRNPRRRARRHRNPGNHGVSPETAVVMGCHSRWHQRLVSRLENGSGQATVEFAVIAAGFMAITVALLSLWRVLGDGLIVEHAVAVASHHVQAVAPATLVDIFLY